MNCLPRLTLNRDAPDFSLTREQSPRFDPSHHKNKNKRWNAFVSESWAAKFCPGWEILENLLGQPVVKLSVQCVKLFLKSR
jgi:hypothetical protein